MKGSLRGGREGESKKAVANSGWIGESEWGGSHPLSRGVSSLASTRRQGPWRLGRDQMSGSLVSGPLPRQLVNGPTGRAGKGPHARNHGVSRATQTPGMLA